MDSRLRRREALAVLGAMERLAAMRIARHSVDPSLRALAVWIEQRLAEIDTVFLTAGSDVDDAGGPWLDTAERCLDFYVSELRRLEDLTGMSPIRSWPSL